jgi:hypothetical protein
MERRIRFVDSLEKAGGEVVQRVMTSCVAHAKWMLATANSASNSSQYERERERSERDQGAA